MSYVSTENGESAAGGFFQQTPGRTPLDKYFQSWLALNCQETFFIAHTFQRFYVNILLRVYLNGEKASCELGSKIIRIAL